MKNILTFVLLCIACTFSWAQQGEDSTKSFNKKTRSAPFAVALPSTPEPLYIVSTNGVAREITKKEVDALLKHPSRVASVSVIKEGDAGLYGERGRNGVVKLEMKPNVFSTPPAQEEHDK